MTATLFAILELERDPLLLSEFWQYFVAWVRDAGGFAIVGLVLFFIFTGARSDTAWAKDQTRKRVLWFMVLLGIVSLGCYAGAAFNRYLEPPAVAMENKKDPTGPKLMVVPQSPAGDRKELLMTLGGACAVLAIALPFLFDLLRVRWRRVWALARLSYKEAVRRRILWVFLGFLLLFLFPPKWFVEVKPENEVRDSIAVIEFAKTVVMILAFGLLAAMSIPTDLKNQTMHTIVTKPVERFEIVLGRFLGYVGLATVVLFGLRLLAFILISASNVSAEARQESFQARVPAYGNIEFLDLRVGKFEGESVGREWDYRKYIHGGPTARQRIVYQFRDFPAGFPNTDALVVPVEFAFDIFRTTKGEENKGVQVSMAFITPAWNESRRPDYLAEMRRLNLNPGRRPAEGDVDWEQQWKKWNELTEKFGFYEFLGKEVADYHTMQILVPASLFRVAASAPTGKAPQLEVRVKCESRTQLIGAAKRDLYVMTGNGSYALNFFKGAFGLWLLVTLVIGLSVTLSTYLSGVISWLTTMFIITVSFFREFILEVAEGRAFGGGPAEAAVRLGGNISPVLPLENTPLAAIAKVIDEGFKWAFYRLLNLLPDVDRFDWSAYVGEGFNIPAGEMVMAALLLAGYLLPWAVLAYYLMKSREIAN